MSAGSSPVNFNLRARAWEYLRAPATMTEGSSAPRVKVVSSGLGRVRPDNSQTATPQTMAFEFP